VKGPKGGIEGGVGVDVKGPQVDVDIGGKPKGGGKFDVHLPKFGFGGKASGGADVDLDVDAKGKTPKGGLDLDITIAHRTICAAECGYNISVIFSGVSG
jgi:hypothetical protein